MRNWSFTFILAVASALLCGCVHEGDPTLGVNAPREAPPPEKTPRLVGRVSGNVYISAHGGFAVTFPVSREYGGHPAADDEQGVTFRDRLGNRISFSSREFAPESQMMAVMRTKGRDQALEILVKDIYGDGITPHYHAELRGGMLSFIYLKPLATRTGVAAFVHQNRVFVVETDLPPGVEFLSKQDDEGALDERLERNAVALAQSIELR